VTFEELVFDALREHCPDFYGLQEVNQNMLSSLIARRGELAELGYTLVFNEGQSTKTVGVIIIRA
jgi:hypothetical protein